MVTGIEGTQLSSPAKIISTVGSESVIDTGMRAMQTSDEKVTSARQKLMRSQPFELMHKRITADKISASQTRYVHGKQSMLKAVSGIIQSSDVNQSEAPST